MECPFCGHDMVSGFVQSGRMIFFAEKRHHMLAFPDPDNDAEVVLSSHNFTGPACEAFHCAECKKVIVEY